MKKKIGFPLLLALLVLAGIVLSFEEIARLSAPPPAPSSEIRLYDRAGVRVVERLHAKALSIGKNVQGDEESYDVVISDGKESPMIVAFQANCCNGIYVQTVTERVVTLWVMPGAGIGTGEFYVADRQTREIRHYHLQDAAYVAATSDGKKILVRDKQGIALQDAFLNDLQRTAFSREGEYVVTGQTSPDDRYVAFVTWNGGRDEDEKWRVYAYDIARNAVKDLGPGVETEKLQWKNATTFAAVIDLPKDEGFSAQERAVYTVPSDAADK